MKKSWLLGVLVLGGIFVVAVTNAYAVITINFDTLSDNELVNTQYAGLGVIFDNEYAQSFPVWSRISSPIWLSGEFDGGTNLIQGPPVSGYFVDPSNSSVFATTDFISTKAAFPDLNTTTYLEAYDLANNLIASTSVPTNRGGVTSISLAQNGIARFNFYWVRGSGQTDDIVGIDDFKFNEVHPVQASTIPEPLSLVFLGMGLLGIAGLKMKK